ncbi:Meiotically up-regulated gene 79 protein [Frankliniella fusca]|uniref:Meiotically up-regulated gene 79 protein n=1 Tax=Frankliniella fusca TaxID=407009 RepID=A0AAE1LA93_9NEOP|nr:Meiotically up-regulated gene 79 protein [Frankliniella fusca]
MWCSYTYLAVSVTGDRGLMTSSSILGEQLRWRITLARLRGAARNMYQNDLSLHQVNCFKPQDWGPRTRLSQGF